MVEKERDEMLCKLTHMFFWMSTEIKLQPPLRAEALPVVEGVTVLVVKHNVEVLNKMNEDKVYETIIKCQRSG